jgi:alkylation response protein AidB-like acyl-CoA dehydrogenase
MDFELSEDQVALADGVRRLCRGRFTMERLRAREGQADAVDREAWRELAGAGVFSLRAPDDPTTSFGMAEAAIVFEELGRALVPGPLVATHMAAACGFASGAATGDEVVGVVRRAGSGSRGAIDGVLVAHLRSLDVLLVVNEDEGEIRAVDAGTVNADLVQHPLDPLSPMWHVKDLPRGDALGAAVAVDVVRWQRDETVLLGAMCVGLAAETLELAVSYAAARQQFGRPIGSFQAVKHLCADMLVRVETARAAVHAAAVTIDQPDVGDADRAAAGAGLLAAEAAAANGRACIQVHGGMGFTWEVPVHLYLMRALVLADGLRPLRELSERVAKAYEEA